MPQTLSVVMAAHQKGNVLAVVLHSILRQATPEIDLEVIVVDDASTDSTATVCHDFTAMYATQTNVAVRYSRQHRQPAGYANQSAALNVAITAARGAILVIQSADVVHMENTLLPLLDVAPQTFNIGTVYNVRAHDGHRLGQYTGPETEHTRRPLFFLGSIHTADILAAGGLSEDFTEPGFEDDFLGLCLTLGQGLNPVYRTDIVGHHVDHPRPDLSMPYSRMREVFRRKVAAGVFHGSLKK